MELAPAVVSHGFTVLTHETLTEIDGEAYMMRHEVSGAKLLYLKNDDSNKAFAIGFRTPPQDDTGVFHILEHSVLCGSRKFPVKEPFVDLLKSSMQTFLNAITYPDKTLYPVASTNEQDLFNLMDVYLDAVFHPQIYTKRAIFEQEGWHYEFAETPEGDCPLIHNGVVYNEMKGVLSDASSVLFDEIQKNLFPGTPYAFESGGTPAAIPTLTYENYLDEHRRHYRTDNSYIILYGNIDIDRALAFLDTEYLTPVAAEQQAEDAERIAQGLELLRPRTLSLAEPIVRTGITCTMDTAPENACAAAAYVIGTAKDRQRIIATSILLDALFGSNEAPFKRALLNEGYAKDIMTHVAESMLQPFVLVQLQQPQGDAGDRLPEILAEHTRQLIEQGLDENLIEASLSHAEFSLREHDLGTADGVVYAASALSGWLYDDDAPLDYLRYEDLFAALRNAFGTSYYTDLLRSLFCENDHVAAVNLIPTPGEPDAAIVEAEKLLALKDAQLTDEEREQIRENVASLRAQQEAEDTPEARATLPRLSVADIGEAPEEPPFRLVDDAPIPCLRHSVPTRGIVYAYRYYDASCIAFEDVPYFSVLMSVLGKLDTASHTAAEIDTLVHGKLGNLSFTHAIIDKDPTSDMPKLLLSASASALSENIEWLVSLSREVMTETNFHQTDKIEEILQQQKIMMEQMFLIFGHESAATRMRSYVTYGGVLSEHIQGVEFYRFICELLDGFENRKDALADKLEAMAAEIFCDDRCLLSFGGSDADYERFWQEQPLIGRTSDAAKRLHVPAPVKRNEGFMLSSDVTYAALGWDRRLLDKPFSGTWFVVNRALSFDYLWNEVRVKGGAYGVGFKSLRTGGMRFYSYRDPHVDETLERFAQTPAWLAQFNPTPEELDGFIVATVAGIDAPIKARKLILKQIVDYLVGITREMHLQDRDNVIATTVEDVRALAPIVQQIVDEQAICVFGSREILKNASTPLELIDLL